MAPKAGLTTSGQFSTAVREIDFVTRFAKNWDALREIMGIMRPIRKSPGTKLVSYKAVVDTYAKTEDEDIVPGKEYFTVSGDTYTIVANPTKDAISNYYERTLAGGDVEEGDEIPFTKMKVEPVSYQDVTFKKYGRSVTAEAVAKYGAEVAVQRTDDAFLTFITNDVMGGFFEFVKTGTLTGSESTWQRALAMAKGSVLEKFAGMDRDATEVVGFANILDLYDYIGDKDITVQTMFGLNYVQNFIGYRTIIFLPEKYIARGQVIALPVENIDLYYIDPADSDFAKLGLTFRTASEVSNDLTNYIGVHVEGDYHRMTGDMIVFYAMTMWAEYLDGIAVFTVNKS